MFKKLVLSAVAVVGLASVAQAQDIVVRKELQQFMYTEERQSTTVSVSQAFMTDECQRTLRAAAERECVMVKQGLPGNTLTMNVSGVQYEPTGSPYYLHRKYCSGHIAILCKDAASPAAPTVETDRSAD